MHKYDMVKSGDRILVCISGGKDSFTLLWFLNERLSRIQIDYELFAVHIDPGFENTISPELKEFCLRQGIDLRVEYTNYGVVAHSDINRENPCFLCSRLRRKHLFEIAYELGCNKVALGHHKDDIIETVFLNMFYAGEISTMVPRQSFFKGLLTVIRPLAFSDEATIKHFALQQGFPRLVNPCPSSEQNKRQEIKVWLQQLYGQNHKIKGNLFRALRNVKIEYLL